MADTDLARERDHRNVGSALVQRSQRRDGLRIQECANMVMAVPSSEVPPQALARVTVQGEAVRIPDDAPIHRAAKRAYLSRFPSSAQTFALGDFALFAILPATARYVGGFAQAKTIGPETLAAALGGCERPGEVDAQRGAEADAFQWTTDIGSDGTARSGTKG